MFEILKYMIVLGIAGMLTLSRGFDEQTSVPSAVASNAAAAADQVYIGPVTLTTTVASVSPGNQIHPGSGVSVVQTNPDLSSPVGNPDTPATIHVARVPAASNVVATGRGDAETPVVPATECRSPGQAYGSLNIRSGATERPAALHPDLNLGQRTWKPVNASLALQNLNGPTDGNAPRFSSLFAPSRIPHMSGAFQVYNWDFRAGRKTTPITSPAVTLIGFATVPGEVVQVPGSGYNIGEGYAALVLYAEPTRVTLKYTREDNVAAGYTLHIENVCVAPELLSLYSYLNSTGRRRLPAIHAGQIIGTANGAQILVGIQDSGTWMDPRSRKDWWQ